MSELKVKGVLSDRLRDLAERLGSGRVLKVGFLNNETYPDGTSLPYVAAIQEFGATIQIQAHTKELYFKQGKNGAIGNKFVKKSKSNFAQEVNVGAYTVFIPPRPFMRNAIENDSGNWSKVFKEAIKRTGSVDQALAILGEKVKESIQDSIRTFTDPPNAKSTIRKKGFDAPLRDTGTLLNHVAYEVKG